MLKVAVQGVDKFLPPSLTYIYTYINSIMHSQAYKITKFTDLLFVS
jgi:hypothetical protein